LFDPAITKPKEVKGAMADCNGKLLFIEIRIKEVAEW